MTNLVLQEKIKRVLEERHKDKQESLVSFIKYFFENEKHKDFDDNWHYYVIQDKLFQILDGKCNRLIINVPPGSGKTELITKCFPVWALGKDPTKQFIVTGYSSSLTQNYGAEARDYYKSETFGNVFPRRPDIRQDQDTKGLWKTEDGGFYLATGTGGSITGNRANIFIIDDPIKPDDADSDIKRIGINNWFDNTVVSRLFNPLTDAIIIICQRTHENDLPGYLMDRAEQGLGEKWDTVILPAIAEEKETFKMEIGKKPYEYYGREEGEALQKERYSIEALETIKMSYGSTNFSCQYQQNPIDKDTQEFHEEWFKYYTEYPPHCRIFTTVDPAFTKNKYSDDSAILTGGFDGEKLYVLESTVGKFDPAELEEKIIYHVKKWNPEKVGIEAYQAQTMIGFSLNVELQKKGIYANIEDLTQRGDKETKIRRLIPLYRNGLIYHKPGMDKLEAQLKKFPRGAHDDVIDCLQMLYDMYTLQPNTKTMYQKPIIKYDNHGRPTIQ